MTRVISLAAKALQKNFPILLLIQLPVGLVIAIQSFLEPYFESYPIVALVVLLPIFSYVSSLCTALTYLVLQSHRKNFRFLCSSLKTIEIRKIKKLAVCSLWVSIFFGLGLAALVLPGFYFLASYIFVPILVMTEPELKSSQYLYESKQLIGKSKKTLFTTILIVAFSFFIEIPISQVVTLIAKFTGGGIFIDSFLTMIYGAFFDCLIVFYFLSLRGKDADEAHSQPT